MTRVLVNTAVFAICSCTVMVLLSCIVGHHLSPENEIVFSANLNDADFEIYRMSLNRGLAAPVTHNFSDDRQPVWSPDGQQIAFVNSFASQYRIYLMDAFGGNVRRLTDGLDDETGPVWSPDGRFIAYEILIDRYASQIVMTDLQSGKVTHLSGMDTTNYSASWSLDSRLIAYASNPGNKADEDIFTVDVANGAIRPLIRTDAYESNPAWSPDGRYLSYTDAPLNPQIFLWDRAQSQSLLLYAPTIPMSYLPTAPKWSPDGRHLLFTMGTINAAPQIYQLDVAVCLQSAANCTPQPLTVQPGSYDDPDWRPIQP